MLEPGELAAGEDQGPTRPRQGEVHAVAPIVFCDDEELLPRADAERELGLEPGMTTVLVQLGQGAEVGRAQDRCLRALAGREGVQVAATSSAIAGRRDVPEGVVHLRATYPISRYYAAFDAAVSAAGYNAFHELIRFRVPSLFVPMQRETDDQRARASYAERAEWGWPPTARPTRGWSGGWRCSWIRIGAGLMHDRLDELRPANGAADAARWLQEVVAHPAAGTAAGGTQPAALARRRSGRAFAWLPPGFRACPGRLPASAAVGLAAAPSDSGRGTPGRGRAARARR